MMYKYFFFVMFFAVSLAEAQESLPLSDAVEIMLKNDFNIEVAENNSRIAQNNASKYANGFLPSVTGRAGANYGLQDVAIDNHDGTSVDTEGRGSLGYNASVGLSYVLFDGLYRAYNYEKSKELYALSKLQVRAVIENALLDLFTTYYTVASLSESTQSLKQTLEISKIRLLRVEYSAEYGKNTQLDVLNAKVDVNTDSINYINSLQNLQNAKRNLNVLLGRGVSTDFLVDTALNFTPFDNLNALLEKAQEENVRMLTIKQNSVLSEYDIKLFKTNIIPSINLNASYGWNGLQNNDKYTIEQQSILGPQAELSMTWNIFDGGRTRVGKKNARIAAENNLIKKAQTALQVERDVVNAYTTYQNSLYVLRAEKENVKTNERNFSRTEEQYKLGQLTAVEFRQAQLNLLFANTSYNQAKYQSKIYELSLLKLSGELLSVEY